MTTTTWPRDMYAGPGGGLYRGPGGGLYAGPGGGLYRGPGGGLYAGPGGGLYRGPGGGLYAGPGGGLYAGPSNAPYSTNKPPLHILLDILRSEGYEHEYQILRDAISSYVQQYPEISHHY